MRKPLNLLLMCMVLGFLLAPFSSAQQAPPGQESGQAAGVTPTAQTGGDKELPCPMHQTGQQPGASAGAPAAHGHGSHRQGKSGDTSSTKGPPQHMQGHHEQMMAEMKAMDSRLAEKVAAMNAASGHDKIEPMAAVINELAAQRTAMREHMMSHRCGMKCAMKGQMAGAHEQGTSPDCPMMKMHRDHSGAPGEKGRTN